MHNIGYTVSLTNDFIMSRSQKVTARAAAVRGEDTEAAKTNIMWWEDVKDVAWRYCQWIDEDKNKPMRMFKRNAKLYSFGYF